MSLTSYRAAPPRAKRIRLFRMSRLRHREAMADCAGAKPKVLSPVRDAPLAFPRHSFCSANDEGSLWATLWNWPGAVVFVSEKIVFLGATNPFDLRFGHCL